MIWSYWHQSIQTKCTLHASVCMCMHICECIGFSCKHEHIFMMATGLFLHALNAHTYTKYTHHCAYAYTGVFNRTIPAVNLFWSTSTLDNHVHDDSYPQYKLLWHKITYIYIYWLNQAERISHNSACLRVYHTTVVQNICSHDSPVVLTWTSTPLWRSLAAARKQPNHIST